MFIYILLRIVLSHVIYLFIFSNVEDEAKDDRFMNVSEKSRWSVVCDTLEEWVNFTEKFKDSKSKNEKSLFTILQENFLPILNKIYEEKVCFICSHYDL